MTETPVRTSKTAAAVAERPTLSSVPPGSRVPSDGSNVRISRISLRRITNLKPTSYLPRLTSVSSACGSATKVTEEIDNYDPYADQM